MSFNRLNWDGCAYQHTLRQSVGSADYIFNVPTIECNACFQKDTTLQMSSAPRISRGVSTCTDIPWIDVDSMMKNIIKPSSHCPADKHMPGSDQCKMTHYPDCTSLPREDTRISNPSCTLRCTGWNRWEWLCRDPQENALVSFDYNINNRLIVKDNHRPCIPTPSDQSNGLPPSNKDDAMVEYNTGSCMKQNDEMFSSTKWRTCKTYDGYF
jgi:hypothetical protein